MKSFPRRGAAAVDRAVKPADVVPTLDAVEHRRVQTLAGRPGSGLDQGTLERGKEVLGPGVVPGIRPCARSTSGRRSAGPVCRSRPSCTDSPVRVGDQAFHRVAIAERHSECVGHEQATSIRRTVACSLLRLDTRAAFIGSPGQREPWLACVSRCPHAGPGSPGAAGEHGPLLGRQTGPFAGVGLGLVHPRAHHRLTEIEVPGHWADTAIAAPAQFDDLSLELRAERPPATGILAFHGLRFGHHYGACALIVDVRQTGGSPAPSSRCLDASR